MAGGLEGVDHLQLLVRQHLGLKIIEMHLAGHPLCDARTVAGQQHQPRDAHRFQPVDRAGRLGPGIVLQADPADVTAVADDVQHGEALGLRRRLDRVESRGVDLVRLGRSLGQPRGNIAAHVDLGDPVATLLERIGHAIAAHQRDRPNHDWAFMA